MLRGLYGREPQPFQTLNFLHGTEQPPHSDTLHFNSDPAGFMCGVWVALEDVDDDNGPLIYYPGSQKLPEVTMQDVGVAAAPEHYGDYERHIGGLIEQVDLQPRYARLRRGQALDLGIQPAASVAPGTSTVAAPGVSQVTHYLLRGLPLLHADEERRVPDIVARARTGSTDQRATRRIS